MRIFKKIMNNFHSIFKSVIYFDGMKFSFIKFYISRAFEKFDDFNFTTNNVNHARLFLFVS